MNMIEFGPANAPALLMLHGGGLSWWSCRDAAARLAQQYRVLVPILDGHSGSNRDFTGIADNADRIISHIDRHLGGQVLLIAGLSLGAQVLTEILSRRPDICQFAVIESALALPMPLTRRLTKPSVALSYGLIRRKWFARLQFRALKIRPDLFEDYYRDTCRITKGNLTAILEANAGFTPAQSLARTRAHVLILAGQREGRIMLRSARHLHRLIPGSTLEILPGMHHGEFSINRPDAYADRLCTLMRDRARLHTEGV